MVLIGYKFEFRSNFFGIYESKLGTDQIKFEINQIKFATGQNKFSK